MFKRTILSTTIFAISLGVALASPAPYVGGGLGITTNTSNRLGYYRGVPLNVFAGYGDIINQNFYVGGELSATLGTGEISDSSLGLKTTYGYGASILPGFMLSDHTLAFARAGIVRTRFTNTGTSSTGGQFGLGLQTTLTQNVDVRGEYNFTAYSSINTFGFSSSPRSDAANLSVVYKFE